MAMINYQIPVNPADRTAANAARTGSMATMINANANATPSLQPGSMSGQYFLPWQEDLARQAASLYGQQFDRYGQVLDAILGRLGNTPGGGTPGQLNFPIPPASPYGGQSSTIPIPGQQIAYGMPGQYQLPEALGMDDFQQWAAMFDKEGPQFTDITRGGVMSPQQIQERTNEIWATQDQRAKTANDLAMASTGFGIGTGSPAMAAILAGNMAVASAVGERESRSYERAMADLNSRRLLEQEMAQTNVENLRGQNMWQGSALALQGYGIDQQAQAARIAAQLQGRGQDVSANLGLMQGDVALKNAIMGNWTSRANTLTQVDHAWQRDVLNAAISRELGHRQADIAQQSALLGALGGFGGGLGGFGGILQPLSYSMSGPAGYIFPSDQYQGVKPMNYGGIGGSGVMFGATNS